MPSQHPKRERERDITRLMRKTRLDMPAIGMESEFNVWLDEKEINPEPYWKHPQAFIDRPLLTRENTSLQLPTGGAVYFDRGVIEVVTPVIELAPSATARMVRNLWEQIGFVREQLTLWGKKTGHTVRLKAYSSHYNISYEIPKSEQNAHRNEKALALLLAYILPVPVMVIGANRRSTGVGVRPRGGRIEITVDFTPDPGLMIATAALIVGIVREVMSWPSYDLSLLGELPIPVVAGVVPGKHTTRKGWLTKDFHYPRSPYTCDINESCWTTQHGETKSLRQIATEAAWFFRRSIRRYSDPFSFRLLFAVLDGHAPSMLELIDRPAAYEDVGRLCKWGSVIHELKNFSTESNLLAWAHGKREPIDQWVVERQQAHETFRRQAHAMAGAGKDVPVPDQNPAASPAAAAPLTRRRSDRPRLMPSRPSPYLDRRGMILLSRSAQRKPAERRRAERRRKSYAIPFPDRRLTRSAYEQVFLKLVSGSQLKVGNDVYTPVGMKGWYHALFRRSSDGSEQLLSIDELLRKMRDWT